MSKAQTRYRTTADGAYIASEVTGTGPPDLLALFGPGLSVEDPSTGRFIERLGAVASAIRVRRRASPRQPAGSPVPARVLAVLLVVAACAATDDDARRDRMVATQIETRGIRDVRVLAAMRAVPRHEFVPVEMASRAYDDGPLPIGHAQTISQPYIVALMTELAGIGPDAKVLEIGTGSGYQAAVLAEVAKDVYSIEIVEPLARRAAATLRRLGYERVHLRTGDGYRGWPEAAPFDAVIVTAAPGTVPAPLLEQLAPGGRLVIPVGTRDQMLEVHRRTPRGIEVERTVPVRFVPMTGAAQGTNDTR